MNEILFDSTVASIPKDVLNPSLINGELKSNSLTTQV